MSIVLITKNHAPPIGNCASEAAFLGDGVGQITPVRPTAQAVEVKAAEILAAAGESILTLQGLVTLGSLGGWARQEGP